MSGWTWTRRATQPGLPGRADERDLRRAKSSPRRRLAVLAALACVVAVYGQSSRVEAQPASTSPGKLVAQVNAYLQPLAHSHYYSGSVLIAGGNKVLLDRGYGMADEAGKIKDAPNTVFPIGSMTKAFTALSILQLQDQHKLSVKDRLCRFVPNCPQNWSSITLNELLTMTSGMRDFSFVPQEDMVSPAKVFAYLGQESPLSRPGDTWAYNDFSYRLLGYVVQKVSGQPYDTYIRNHIFKVVGMNHTKFYASLLSTPHHALAYSGTRTDQPITQNPAGAWPANMTFFDGAGGIISTVDDLRRWNHALDTTKLLSKSALQSMFKPHVTTGNGAGGPAFSEQYGYGWFIDKVYNQVVDQHRGGAGPYWGYTFRFPGSHMLIIVLSNRPDADGGTIMTNLTRIVLGKG